MISFNNVQCGNEKHPDGAWHRATPVPFIYPFWMFWKNGPWRRYKRNEREWGCGCDRLVRIQDLLPTLGAPRGKIEYPDGNGFS